MQVNTNTHLSPLKSKIMASSQEKNNNNFGNILSQNIAKKEAAMHQINTSAVPNHFELEDNSASIVKTLTTGATPSSLSSSASTKTQSENKTYLVVDPSAIAEENASDCVKVEINGNTMTFSIDMSKTDGVNITVKKNEDGSYTFNITDESENNDDTGVTDATNGTTDNTDTGVSTNPTTTTTTNTNNTSFELYDEEWMISGHDYSNPDPAYSPVTGNPLNVSMGDFLKMMDRASWDPVTKTHPGTPTGQSWTQFQYMLASGLDPYVTLFY